MLIVLLLLTGCCSSTPSENAVEVIDSTIIPYKTESHRDYTGEVPSDDELRLFFSNYGYEMVKARMSREEVFYIDSVENYALVLLDGEGPRIDIYEFSYSDGRIQVVAQARGEVTTDAALSLNHIEAGGKHFYYGDSMDHHGNRVDHVIETIDWDTLKVTDTKGNSIDIDMVNKMGYLCILDAPMADFQVIDTKGNVCLDFSAYIEQEYVVFEREFKSIA